MSPEVVFEIFSHPDNAGAFRDIKKVGYRKVGGGGLCGERGGGRMHLVIMCIWPPNVPRSGESGGKRRREGAGAGCVGCARMLHLCLKLSGFRGALPHNLLSLG